MGRARGTAAGRGGISPTAVTPSFLDTRTLLRDDEGIAVGELLELPDGSRMEIQEGDPASLLRGLVEVKSTRFIDGNYEISFQDGDVALLNIADGRITFASGEESPSKILGAFARGLGARSTSGDPLSISNDPETRRLFDELSLLQRKLLEDPHNQDLLRDFARVSDQLMQKGILHQSEQNQNLASKPLMPEGIEVNGVGLARRMAGLPEEDRYSMDEKARKNKDLADRVYDYVGEARERIEALGENAGPIAQLAARSPSILFFTDGVDPEELDTVWTSEKIQPRLQAALFASGQIDADGNPTGKYEQLSPYLDGTNPEQTIGIPMSKMYDPTKPYHPANEDKIPYTPSQLAAMDVMRLEHRGGKRFFLLRGPASSGKDTIAREFAAGNLLTSIPIQLGGRASTGVESAIGVDSLATQFSGGVPETDEAGNLVMVQAYERNPDDGSLKIDPDTNEPIALLDENDNPVMVPKIKEETATTVSATSLGQIGRLADEPVCFIISDPDGHEKEFSRLHAAFGDNVGETEGRFIMVDSSTGDYVEVHPETCFVITTNEVETPENHDGTPKRATQSRACAVDVGSPSEKEEADRLAHLVRKQLQFDHPLANTHSDFNPELAELDISADDLGVFARMQIKLVAAASQSGMIEETLSARETSSMAASFFAACMGGSTSQDPVEVVMSRLTRLVRTKGGQRSEGDIRQAIEAVISDEKAQLIDMVGPTRERLHSIELGKGDPVAKERAEAAKAAEEAVPEKEEV